ncbi:MAG: hypothetical protein AB8B49_03925 [Nitratireductor sp.]
MNLSAPTKWVFLISVIIAILAILMHMSIISFAAIPSFSALGIAYVILLAGCLLKGL